MVVAANTILKGDQPPKDYRSLT